MADTHTALEKAERRATFALWSISGVGLAGMETLRTAVGSLPLLLPLSVADWDPLPAPGPLVARHLEAHGLPTLSEVADQAWERVKAARMRVCFRDDPAYPPLLRDPRIQDSPPLLFYFGPGASDRRAVALVGSRRTGGGFVDQALRFAKEVAGAKVAVVSGAAVGVDWGCHVGAILGGGETWAFLGSALDQIDSAQSKLCKELLDGGGTVFSEYPPGARASRQTFPRRNRLIAGASEATVVMRARRESGALYTAQSAHKYGRKVYVLPADHFNAQAFGGLDLMASEVRATLIWSARELLERLNVVGSNTAFSQVADLDELSPVARQAYEAMSRTPQGFDEVQRVMGVDAGALVSALSELELFGLVVQHPGKLYERI
ncbi:MAG: DNA-protecting protein DprA [Myxococcota bacterium]|nr:DNA-protecting protein DprA [Myxococcota bacterium]